MNIVETLDININDSELISFIEEHFLNLETSVNPDHKDYVCFLKGEDMIFYYDLRANYISFNYHLIEKINVSYFNFDQLEKLVRKLVMTYYNIKRPFEYRCPKPLFKNTRR